MVVIDFMGLLQEMYVDQEEGAVQFVSYLRHGN